MLKLDANEMTDRALMQINNLGTFHEKDMELIKFMLSPSIKIIKSDKQKT